MKNMLEKVHQQLKISDSEKSRCQISTLQRVSINSDRLSSGLKQTEHVASRQQEFLSACGVEKVMGLNVKKTAGKLQCSSSDFFGVRCMAESVSS